MLDGSRVALALYFSRRLAMSCLSFPQVAAQAHVQGDGDAHYYERAYAQDQEPPDHPHDRLG
jgi:hypothetical protein